MTSTAPAACGGATTAMDVAERIAHGEVVDALLIAGVLLLEDRQVSAAEFRLVALERSPPFVINIGGVVEDVDPAQRRVELDAVERHHFVGSDRRLSARDIRGNQAGLKGRLFVVFLPCSIAGQIRARQR